MCIYIYIHKYMYITYMYIYIYTYIFIMFNKKTIHYASVGYHVSWFKESNPLILMVKCTLRIV